jgi:hypothetical protein
LWLNLVCLDAPVVAITWQWFFARSYRVALPVGGGEALFFTAWFIYLIDRYVDSVSLPPGAPKSLRQQFWSRHRNVWPGLLFLVGLADAAVILWRLDRWFFLAGACVGLAALAYLTLNHVCNRLWNLFPVKELTIGFLFAAGTLLVPALSPARPALFLPAALFACLCSLNCISIAFWERDLDRFQAKYSIATRWPGAQLYAQLALVVIALVAAVFALLHRQLWVLGACLGLSALLLFLLHLVRLPEDERSALADLVLLTPLLFLGKMW